MLIKEGALLLRQRRQSGWLLAALFIIGVFIGNLAGEALSPILPLLARSAPLGFSASTVSLLNVVELTFGLSLHVNLAGVLVGVLALLLGRRF